MIKLYGLANGYGSRAIVTRGFKYAIEKAAVPLEFCAIDQDDGDFYRMGDGAPVAIMTGPLEASSVVSPSHARRFALVAPNGTAIPPGMRSLLKHVYTDIIVPSHWAVQAVDSVGLPVHVVPHGIFSKEIAAADRSREDLREDYLHYGRFNVVHYSSSYGERKGTIELVRAWQELRSEDGRYRHSSQLTLVLDHQAQVRFEQDYDGEMSGVTITPRLDGSFRGSGASPTAMANSYRSFHAVCQPSRGEAFGLIPLEALASGVPVIMTDGSGHSEYIGEPEMHGAVPIMTGPTAPVDDCEGAKAPSVDVESIKRSLVHTRNNWTAIENLARQYRAQILYKWDWSVQLETFISGIVKGTI
jgi:glycosyltransferase involved in cell wall biosynthesis